MALVNGNVKEFAIDPEPPVDPDRIPVTDAHRHGVFDPMTGSMLRVPGNGEPISAGSLPHRAADLRWPHALRPQARFQADGNRQAEKGYQGPVVVCAIYFSPVSGYIPDRPVIKYLAAQRKMEIAFAPMAEPDPGAVPHGDPDPARHRDAGSDAVHHHAVPPRVAKTK